MKFVIFGATGRTGQALVQQALDKGHQVKAIVRNPDKVTTRHDNLEVVKSDIFSADDLSGHVVSSCDAVFSCLGSPSSIFKEINVYSASMPAICTAMRNNGVKRLVCMSGWYVEESSAHPWFIKPLQLVLSKMLQDIRRMETYLESESEDIDYTAVRPPGLTEDKLDGRKLLAEGGVDYSAAMLSKLPRADVAKFMLKTVEENLFVKQFVAIGLPKS